MIYGRNDNNNNKDVDTHSKYHLTRGLQGASLIISPTQASAVPSSKSSASSWIGSLEAMEASTWIPVRWNSHHKLTRGQKLTHNNDHCVSPRSEARGHNSSLPSHIRFAPTLCSRVWRPGNMIPDEGGYSITRVSGQIVVLFGGKHFMRLDLKLIQELCSIVI
jgi:hypothetical protein